MPVSALGGTLVGLLVGALIGATRRAQPASKHVERALTTHPADRTEWYVHDDAGERGPLKKPEIQALLRQGLLGLHSHVWRVGFTRWVPLGEVDEFALARAEPLGRAGPVRAKYQPTKRKGT